MATREWLVMDCVGNHWTVEAAGDDAALLQFAQEHPELMVNVLRYSSYSVKELPSSVARVFVSDLQTILRGSSYCFERDQFDQGAEDRYRAAKARLAHAAGMNLV